MINTLKFIYVYNILLQKEGSIGIMKNGLEVFPGIVMYEGIIDNCQELIDLGVSNKEFWQDSKIGGHLAEETVDKNVRSNRLLHVPATYGNDIRWFGVSQKIWQYANEYGKHYGASFSGMEYLQLLHYVPNEGFYQPHSDDGPGMTRTFSAILYLNDVEVGGETYFNRLDIAINPKAGRLIIFPANYVFMHEARPPQSNDKFALVTWFRPILGTKE